MEINRFQGNLQPIRTWINQILENKDTLESIIEIIDRDQTRLIFTFKEGMQESQDRENIINSEQWDGLLSK